MAPIVDVTQSAPKPDKAKPAIKAAVKTPPKPVGASPAPGATYTVKKGDTVFAIAFANGLDYRELAAWNELPSANSVRVGQVLRLTSPMPGLPNAKGVQVLAAQPNEPESKPLPEPPLFTQPQALHMPWSEANWAKVNAEAAKTGATAEPAEAAEQGRPAHSDAASSAADLRQPPVAKAEVPNAAQTWVWPATGALLGRFGEAGGKGVDLAGERGASVVATAPGRVVYSGSGLRGYGQLVIIKHANEYLSAYAHNQKILVREGEQVAAGQKIAEMGDSEADRVKLHFEIRQFGKPIDPLKLLPNRS
ncbi:MAG TPA: peptidoglycan DD-metalloendopeptidase family protein [Thiobacillaceae bacterium]|nr:peptidoglycan DD-metalloendopeptidase family protein [Thiobacillaceae bacterium]